MPIPVGASGRRERWGGVRKSEYIKGRRLGDEGRAAKKKRGRDRRATDIPIF